ncbi:MAG: hypothetical protein V7776_12320 [Halopseudomonas aestusnigri]
MSIESFKERLSCIPAKKSGKYLEKIALDMNVGPLLGGNTDTAEYYDLILSLFDNTEICSKRGTYRFVSIMYQDFKDLTLEQQNVLLEKFVCNYELFTDHSLRLFVTDLIARCYDFETAIKAFEEIEKNNKTDTLDELFVGLDILIWGFGESTKEHLRIIKLCEKIQSRLVH